MNTKVPVTTLFCCECAQKVSARLTDGKEIYPHRYDLQSLPFWKCPVCGNYVGCHHKTKDPTKPLGPIPNKEIRQMRKEIHELIDPLWRSQRVSRNEIYTTLSLAAGYVVHLGELVSLEEGERLMDIIKIAYKRELESV